MKKILYIAIFLISIGAIAQKEIVKEIGGFHTLKVFDLIEVNLIKSNTNQVVIKGQDVGDVKVLNENGKLKIRMVLDNRFNGEQTFVEVHYTDINVIDANEGSIIVSNELIKQNTIELKAQEGARIRVGLDVNHSKIKSTSGAVITASGTSKSQEINLTAGGVFEGRELNTLDATIKITAAGEAEVNVSNQVDVSVIAGGDVYIYGDPETVNKKTFAGGRVKVMNH